MIFFGPPRLLLVFVGLFVLFPLFFYAPGLALLIGGALVLATVVGSGRRRREVEGPSAARELEPRRPFAEVRSAAQDDLLALADDIRALDIDMELPGASEEARRHYERALDRYDEARRAFDAARAPEDFEPVSHAVEEGRFDIASAKALHEGREPPERRPPCFFDPRHGPSVRDVEWAPPGGAPRPVPACAADAIRIEEGGSPQAREVLVGGRRVPYWDAPAYYGPWAGGFYGGAGGILPGLLFGSLLGMGVSTLDPFGIDGDGDGDAYGGDPSDGGFGGDFGGDLGGGE